MFITAAERTDLGHLGVRAWTTERHNDLVLPAKDGCILVWLSEQQALIPDLIVVEDGELQTFLAWTMTYVPQLCPLTALVRVVEHGVAAKEMKVAASKSIKSSDRGIKFLRGCLGLVNAEVVAAYRGSFAPYSAGLTPYLSSLSWLTLQVLHLKSDQSVWKIFEAWDETRQLLKASCLDYSPRIEEVWEIVAHDEFDRDPERSRQVQQIREFLSAVADGRESESIFEFTQEHAKAIQAVRTGPLEARMDVFRKLLHALDDKVDAPPINAVLIGYALSQISQGSFSHIGVLGPGRVLDVRPLLWYGWFEFSRGNGEASSPAVTAANLQLMKRIQELPLKARCCNIALDELRVLARLKEPFAECLLDVRHPISVEVIGGAITMVQAKPVNKQYTPRKRQGQLPLFDSIND